MAVIGDAVPAQSGTGTALLPGHQIRVVFELRDDDLVAGADRVLTEALIAHRERHEVECLGGVLGEDELVHVRADEPCDIRPGALVGVGRLLRELVRAAVYGRVRAQRKSRSASSTWIGRCEVAPESR